MPKGPQGEKRPADAIGRAILVAKIATGEVEDDVTPAARVHKSKGGKKGAEARTMALTPEQRSEIARAAASARWKKS